MNLSLYVATLYIFALVGVVVAFGLSFVRDRPSFAKNRTGWVEDGLTFALGFTVASALCALTMTVGAVIG